MIDLSDSKNLNFVGDLTYPRKNFKDRFTWKTSIVSKHQILYVSQAYMHSKSEIS